MTGRLAGVPSRMALKMKWSRLTLVVGMKDEELRYFENLCNMLYGPSSQQEKQKADEELTKVMKNPSFANDVEYLRSFGVITE